MTEKVFPPVKGHVSGKQADSRIRIRFSRFDPFVDAVLHADNATSREHFWIDIGDKYIEVELPGGEYLDLHQKLRGGSE